MNKKLKIKHLLCGICLMISVCLLIVGITNWEMTTIVGAAIGVGSWAINLMNVE